MIEYFVPACEIPPTEGEIEFEHNKLGCTKYHARNLRAKRNILSSLI